MGYLSIKQTSQKWNISAYYCNSIRKHLTQYSINTVDNTRK